MIDAEPTKIAARSGRAQSRKHRGYRTQHAIAERWRLTGFAPYAKAAGAGEQGSDVQDVPGLKVEIKARDTVSLPAAIRQASLAPGPGVPIVITRHNGQGEAVIDQWTVAMRLVDFEQLWLRASTKGVDD
jgi:hypothetical protein